jgi:hypothetical protein
METVAVITMLLATVGLLALLVGASRGFRLPVEILQPRTWVSAVAVTGSIGGAVALGGILVEAEAFAATAIGVTAVLLVVELALWSDAFTFGSRER